MRFVVFVRSAIVSTRAPASPIAENSCVATSRMLRLVCSGSYLRRASDGMSLRSSAAVLLLFFILCVGGDDKPFYRRQNAGTTQLSAPWPDLPPSAASFASLFPTINRASPVPHPLPR